MLDELQKIKRINDMEELSSLTLLENITELPKNILEQLQKTDCSKLIEEVLSKHKDYPDRLTDLDIDLFISDEIIKYKKPLRLLEIFRRWDKIRKCRFHVVEKMEGDYKENLLKYLLELKISDNEFRSLMTRYTNIYYDYDINLFSLITVDNINTDIERLCASTTVPLPKFGASNHRYSRLLTTESIYEYFVIADRYGLQYNDFIQNIYPLMIDYSVSLNDINKIIVSMGEDDIRKHGEKSLGLFHLSHTWFKIKQEMKLLICGRFAKSMQITKEMCNTYPDLTDTKLISRLYNSSPRFDIHHMEKMKKLIHHIIEHNSIDIERKKECLRIILTNVTPTHLDILTSISNTSGITYRNIFELNTPSQGIKEILELIELYRMCINKKYLISDIKFEFIHQIFSICYIHEKILSAYAGYGADNEKEELEVIYNRFMDETIFKPEMDLIILDNVINTLTDIWYDVDSR